MHTLEELRAVKRPEVNLPSRFDRYSYSRIARYHQCGYVYSLEFNEKLLPQVDPIYLTRGTICHQGLEFALLSQFLGNRGSAVVEHCIEATRERWKEWRQDPFVAGLCEEDESFAALAQELCDDAEQIASRVVKRFGLNTDRWETQVDKDGFPMIEYDLLVPIDDTDEVFHARLDWVVKENGELWELDWKFRKNLQDDAHDEMNAQHGVYTHLLRRNGFPVVGCITAQVRAAVPKQPKMNKPTKKIPKAMSRSACATDWETYCDALLKVGLDPSDYLEMKDKLSDFERLSKTLRSTAESAGIWLEWQYATHALIKGTAPFFRNMSSYNCKGCKYKDLCLERARGYDPSEQEIQLFGLTTPALREKLNVNSEVSHEEEVESD